METNSSSAFAEFERYSNEKLLESFTDNANLPAKRRWAGLALQERIIQSSEAKQKIFSQRKQLPALGLVLRIAIEELKTISITIISALIDSKEDLERFFPEESIKALAFEKFPLGQSQSQSWAADVDEFLNSLLALDGSQQRRVDLRYAVGIHFQAAKETHLADGFNFCLILAEDSSMLTVCRLPPSSTDPFYLDIPLPSIRAANVLAGSVSLSGGQSKPVSLLALQLLRNYEFNGKECDAQHISILFPSERDATDALNVLIAADVRFTSSFSRASQGLMPVKLDNTSPRASQGNTIVNLSQNAQTKTPQQAPRRKLKAPRSSAQNALEHKKTAGNQSRDDDVYAIPEDTDSATPTASSKARIVHFNRNGPRNQGSKRGSKRGAIDQPLERTTKRKKISEVPSDEVGHEELIPNTQRSHPSQSRRSNSQRSVRITEEGSPQPIRDRRRKSMPRLTSSQCESSEVFSSNSKPRPADPHNETQAITNWSTGEEINEAINFTSEQSLHNPFQNRAVTKVVKNLRASQSDMKERKKDEQDAPQNSQQTKPDVRTEVLAQNQQRNEQQNQPEPVLPTEQQNGQLDNEKNERQTDVQNKQKNDEVEEGAAEQHLPHAPVLPSSISPSPEPETSDIDFTTWEGTLNPEELGLWNAHKRLGQAAIEHMRKEKQRTVDEVVEGFEHNADLLLSNVIDVQQALAMERVKTELDRLNSIAEALVSGI